MSNFIASAFISSLLRAPDKESAKIILEVDSGGGGGTNTASAPSIYDMMTGVYSNFNFYGNPTDLWSLQMTVNNVTNENFLFINNVVAGEGSEPLVIDNQTYNIEGDRSIVINNSFGFYDVSFTGNAAGVERVIISDCPYLTGINSTSPCYSFGFYNYSRLSNSPFGVGGGGVLVLHGDLGRLGEIYFQQSFIKDIDFSGLTSIKPMYGSIFISSGASGYGGAAVGKMLIELNRLNIEEWYIIIEGFGNISLEPGVSDAITSLTSRGCIINLTV